MDLRKSINLKKDNISSNKHLFSVNSPFKNNLQKINNYPNPSNIKNQVQSSKLLNLNLVFDKNFKKK